MKARCTWRRVDADRLESLRLDVDRILPSPKPPQDLPWQCLPSPGQAHRALWSTFPTLSNSVIMSGPLASKLAVLESSIKAEVPAAVAYAGKAVAKKKNPAAVLFGGRWWARRAAKLERGFCRNTGRRSRARQCLPDGLKRREGSSSRVENVHFCRLVSESEKELWPDAHSQGDEESCIDT